MYQQQLERKNFKIGLNKYKTYPEISLKEICRMLTLMQNVENSKNI